MGSLSHYLREAAGLPPDLLIRKALHKAATLGRASWQHYLDSHRNTHLTIGTHPPLSCHFLPIERLADAHLDEEVAHFLTEMYCSHRFDLLGSGWTAVGYDSLAAGTDGHRYDMRLSIGNLDPEGGWLARLLTSAHVVPAQSIWRLVSPGYSPIDWQCDFKSGYRWDCRRGYLLQPVAPVPGADIKVPWELARLQHLPQLALCALALPDSRDFILHEFRNQTLDFIATNPPRMGVNWACTMDVAIRAANLLVAWDILTQLDRDGVLDPEFQQIVARSTREHAVFIAANLEWSSTFTGNHYLSNIAGLLFAAAYLESTPESDRWLAFAIRELGGEVRRQFHEEGSNYEASTCYHRLSTEIVVYTTALVLGLSDERLQRLASRAHANLPSGPPLATGTIVCRPLPGGNGISPFDHTHFRRIEGMAAFTRDLTAQNHRIAQIGDNDSGRFIKFTAALQAVTVDHSQKTVNYAEDQLDHRHLLDAARGLFNTDHYSAHEITDGGETLLVRTMAGGRFATRQTVVSADATSPAITAYPGFGVYIYRSRRLHIAIRCGSNGQEGLGGHAHNDQLSLSLTLDGRQIFADPGTYLYTPAPEWRNRLRATAAHSTVAIQGCEQNRWDEGPRGLFLLRDRARATCATWSMEGSRACFEGEHYGFAEPAVIHRRQIVIDEVCGEIVITDSLGRDDIEAMVTFTTSLRPEEEDNASLDLAGARLQSSTGSWMREESCLSSGYGAIIPAYRVKAPFRGHHETVIAFRRLKDLW